MSLGRDDVGPGLGVADAPSGASSSRLGSLSTSPSTTHAAVAVVGVGAQADVGDDDHLGHGVLDRRDRGLDDTVRVVAGAGARVLVVGDAEQQDRRDAGRERAAGRAGAMRSGDWRAWPGSEAIGCSTSRPVDGEHRQDQLVGRQTRLADHPADRRAARAGGAIAHLGNAGVVTAVGLIIGRVYPHPTERRPTAVRSVPAHTMADAPVTRRLRSPQRRPGDRGRAAGGGMAGPCGGAQRGDRRAGAPRASRGTCGARRCERPAEVAEALDRAHREFGRLDLVVNATTSPPRDHPSAAAR